MGVVRLDSFLHNVAVLIHDPNLQTLSPRLCFLYQPIGDNEVPRLPIPLKLAYSLT